MSPDAFRTLALSLPETVEGSHHQHPDFRVGGKVFATLGPDGSWAMLKLPVSCSRRSWNRSPSATSRLRVHGAGKAARAWR